MITQIPLDPMHLRDIGMRKRCLKLLLNKSVKKGKLRASEIDKISEILVMEGG